MLHDRKDVDGLQELINKRISKEKALGEHRTVKNIANHKAQIGGEMRLTTQIGDGPGHRGSGVQCKFFTETDMGKDVETCAPLVSDSTQNGELAENHPHGMIIWINGGY